MSFVARCAAALILANVPSAAVQSQGYPAKSLRMIIPFPPGGPTDLMLMEMFKSMTGVDMLHVPYKGQAAAVVDQISGQIEVAFNTAVTVMPHVQAGKLKPVAISTLERFPPMPSLPTVDEGGVKGFDGSSWQGVVMPAGTPREIVARIYQELSGMLKAPETRERFLTQGALASGMTPDQFQDFVKREAAKWARVAKAAKVQVD